MTNDLTSNAIEPPLPATHAGSLAQWGMDQVAYIKREILDGDTVFAIHAADGEPMAAAPSRDIAAAIIVQNEMVPVDAH